MTTTSDTPSPFLDKIRKLLAKASATPHAAEAEAFRAKAFELMMREGISESELKAKADEFRVETRSIKLRSTTWREDILLAATVANTLGCVVRYTAYAPGTGARAFFYGSPIQIEAAEQTLNMLLLQRDRASRRRPAYESQREFASGFTLGVSRSLRDARKEVADADASLLPALQDAQKRIEDQLEKARKGNIRPAGAGAAGISAGATADTGLRSRLEDGARKALGA